ncbi:hypothetical protein PAECIP111894_03738 [Paenibacillus pseudetheri]|jgi:hypothetical protein|uniref:Bacteriocin n=1 Tax=Paenibacillus pseudetheri TaxID=2897682 RepID=A0ABN8FHP0_9BACL|nr:hypothetical protein PAECIP111894_03738 [Paenibacillus pseudetheri]
MKKLIKPCKLLKINLVEAYGVEGGTNYSCNVVAGCS